MMSFALFGATENKVFRTAIANTNSVYSAVLIVGSNHSDNTLSVRNSPVSQQKDLFRVSFFWLLRDELQKRMIYLGASHICRHFFYLLNCHIHFVVTVFNTAWEHLLTVRAKTNHIEISIFRETLEKQN